MFIKSIIDLIEKNGTVTVIAANSMGSGEEVFNLSAGEWKRLCRSLSKIPSELDEITEELYDLMKAADERTSCLTAAARMLSSSDKSAKTLSRRLREKGFSESAAAHSLRLLTEKGYLNEDESCRSYAISAVRSKHYGRRRIVEYLVSHGYPTDAAKHAADGIPDEDYRDALVYNIEKKCPDLAELPRAEQQKKIAALVRLGFTPGEIFDAIRKHK